MTEDNIISSPEETEEHTHPHEHTHSHEHPHDHHPNHTHTHSPEHTKNVINRMNRAIGHMESVRTMVEEGRDCSEVLIQIAAVRSAINNIGKLILKEHIDHCVVDAVETGDQQCLDDLEDAINKFIK
jgi:DNA-binding FrmR family transcriptional regulator